MNAAHVHLMLNHFPIVGMVFAIPLLLMAWGRKSEDLSRAAFCLVSITGLIAVATFLTGEPAEDAVKHLPGISKQSIELHEEAAEKAIWFVGGAALAAMVSLVLGFKNKVMPRRALLLVTALCAASMGVLAWTNNLGGQISHVQLRKNQ